MTLAGISIFVWLGFVLFVALMLFIDLFVLHKEAHEVKLREALGWSAVWITLSLIFSAVLYGSWDWLTGGEPYGRTAHTAGQATIQYLTGYLIEYALSVDNIFVFLVVFSFFHVPAKYQHRVLFFGILGAVIFRALFIGIGAAVLHRWFWMMLVFGAFLIFTGVKMAVSHDQKIDPEHNWIIKLFRRMMPVTKEYHGQKFFIRRDGRLWATPLFITLLFIEATDIVFAVDSIPAIFAVTDHPFIVFTSNIFAIMGLRSLFFAMAGLMKLFRYLSYGLSAILIFVGCKMIYNYLSSEVLEGWPHFPTVYSLAVIALILATAIIASIFNPGTPETIDPEEMDKILDEKQGE